MDGIAWGILGTGDIAGIVAEHLARLAGARLVAVGSRSEARARAFAERHGVPRAHGSYAALVGDPDLDVVHVATPHPFHRRDTLLALEAGKAVLCEKPFAMRASEAREMVGAARDRGIFLMEAMWTKFLPAMERVREWLAEGAIGEPRLLQADFGFHPACDPASPTVAGVAGSEGRIVLHRRWWFLERATLVRERAPERPETVERPFEGNGYQFQAVHVGACLREGRMDSLVMPLEETVAVMETMDRIRAAWGLRYPGEEGG